MSTPLRHILAHQTDDSAPVADSAQRTLPGDDPADGGRAFLRMVSHELRTPLNSIIGFSEVLRHEHFGPLGSPQYHEYAGIIHDSGRRLLGLFDDVLEIVRLQGGNADVICSPQQVLLCLEDALLSHAGRAEARNIRFSLRLKDENLSGYFDVRAVGICLDHLIDNALSHAPEGSLIEVSAKAVGDDIDIWVFNVGAAPTAEEIDRLMRPFEIGPRAPGRSQPGAGLGWAIVKLYCQAMGGDFKVTTSPGLGLKAILRLKSQA
ncbi:sensor histidine kinase [Asticcacaulis machinosus]|uniref:histidine kinase n=1 Tax=Asticcacaulis machinosus TaxID=2984211 RepID=A0ABT5HIZ3_9CAUL|nr:HAMP domain-containing sensor histidine kinase [Asticcacaulis machinosus]MDC7676206.1 HAMP domain-containing sensor histidine kinase [Asticcacaulis machinosus]